MGQILRQSRAAGLKRSLWDRRASPTSPVNRIAGQSAEGMLVTKPKNYDEVQPHEQTDCGRD